MLSLYILYLLISLKKAYINYLLNLYFILYIKYIKTEFYYYNK